MWDIHSTSSNTRVHPPAYACRAEPWSWTHCDRWGTGRGSPLHASLHGSWAWSLRWPSCGILHIHTLLSPEKMRKCEKLGTTFLGCQAIFSNQWGRYNFLFTFHFVHNFFCSHFFFQILFWLKQNAINLFYKNIITFDILCNA